MARSRATITRESGRAPPPRPTTQWLSVLATISGNSSGANAGPPFIALPSTSAPPAWPTEVVATCMSCIGSAGALCVMRV